MPRRVGSSLLFVCSCDKICLSHHLKASNQFNVWLLWYCLSAFWSRLLVTLVQEAITEYLTRFSLNQRILYSVNRFGALPLVIIRRGMKLHLLWPHAPQRQTSQTIRWMRFYSSLMRRQKWASRSWQIKPNILLAKFSVSLKRWWNVGESLVRLAGSTVNRDGAKRSGS